MALERVTYLSSICNAFHVLLYNISNATWEISQASCSVPRWFNSSALWEAAVLLSLLQSVLSHCSSYSRSCFIWNFVEPN